MNSTTDRGEDFLDAMLQFRNTRAAVVEMEYGEKFFDKRIFRRRNELYGQILRLLGSRKHLMMEFADCDAACCTPNMDYFYFSGFDDCLLFLQTLDHVGGRDMLLEKILKWTS